MTPNLALFAVLSGSIDGRCASSFRQLLNPFQAFGNLIGVLDIETGLRHTVEDDGLSCCQVDDTVGAVCVPPNVVALSHSNLVALMRSAISIARKVRIGSTTTWFVQVVVTLIGDGVPLAIVRAGATVLRAIKAFGEAAA